MQIRGFEIKIKDIILVFIAVVAVSSAVYNWYKPAKVITKTEYQEVPKEKVITKIKTVYVPGPKQIATIEKEKLAEELNIYDFKEEEQPIANADIPPSKAGVSIVTVMNTTTGESHVIAKEKQLSLFGFENTRELGIRYGLSTQDGQAGNLFARWHFLRIGSFHIGAYGEIATKPEAKGMLEIAYQF